MKQLIFILTILLSSLGISAQSLTDALNERKKFLKDSIEEVNRRAEQLRREESTTYQRAITSHNLTDLNYFKSTYPNSKYISEINEHIAECKLWESAKSTNTKSAYQNYLNSSKFKFFSDVAYARISDLNSIEEWNAMGTRTQEKLQSFMNKYPNSSKSGDARFWLAVRKGEAAYEGEDFREAKRQFDIAGYNNLDNENKNRYNSCVEEVAFYDIQNTNSEGTLQAFLDRYPNSWHYNEVSNRLAVIKAKQLNGYSSESEYAKARSYSKDDETLSNVNVEISRAQRERRQIRRQERREERREAGNMVQFAWEIVDFGMASSSLTYNMGFGVKFGNYKTPVQLELGAKAGFMCYHEDFDFENSEFEFQLPVYAKLKLNLFSAGSSKFFLCGLGEYNAVKGDYGHTCAFGGGLGFSWRTCDWNLYYKKLTFDDDEYGFDYGDYADDWLIGTSVTAYF